MLGLELSVVSFVEVVVSEVALMAVVVWCWCLQWCLLQSIKRRRNSGVESRSQERKLDGFGYFFH